MRDSAIDAARSASVSVRAIESVSHNGPLTTDIHRSTKKTSPQTHPKSFTLVAYMRQPFNSEWSFAMRVKFDETSIQRLFGHEAAEDEDVTRLREYYFKSSTYDQVNTDLPLRILVGHKGIGKSALFTVALAEHAERREIAIVIRPDDVLDIVQSADFLSMVRQWKSGLRKLITRRAGALLKAGPAVGAIANATEAPLADLLELAKSLRPTPDLHYFIQKPQIRVFIDDLDRGWDGSRSAISRISTLFTAARDLSSENPGLQFRISLRSDVYFLVRTSDESTDKIEGSVIWQSWTNLEIFRLLVQRVETYLGNSVPTDIHTRRQKDLARYLSPVFEERFRGRGHWANAPTDQVLMSLIRKRPRDLVKLCTLAARDTHKSGRTRIYTDNLENVFEEYSQGRIQDTVNEFRSELPEVERLLLSMKPTVRERTTKQGFVYSTGELVRKISNIESQGKFLFHGGRPASTQDLAAFMYKINFLTARLEKHGGKIQRRYFEEQRYLQSQFADFGFDWEIHPAYRWALQPGDLDAIYSSRLFEN